MLVKDLMTSTVIWCTPWGTAETAATLMKVHGVGAIPVAVDPSDPLVEAMVTNPGLCCGVFAAGKTTDAVRVVDLITAIPLTCGAEDTLEECEALMQEGQVRRLPVVNDRGRCVGIVAQADIALHAPAAQVASAIMEISKTAKPRQEMHFKKDYFFYCEQPHELDQILLLNRRRKLAHQHEVLV